MLLPECTFLPLEVEGDADCYSITSRPYSIRTTTIAYLPVLIPWLLLWRLPPSRSHHSVILPSHLIYPPSTCHIVPYYYTTIMPDYLPDTTDATDYWPVVMMMMMYWWWRDGSSDGWHDVDDDKWWWPSVVTYCCWYDCYSIGITLKIPTMTERRRYYGILMMTDLDDLILCINYWYNIYCHSSSIQYCVETWKYSGMTIILQMKVLLLKAYWRKW